MNAFGMKKDFDVFFSLAMAAAKHTGYGIGTRAGAGDMVEVDGGDFNYDDKVFVETSQDKAYDYYIHPVGAISNGVPRGPTRFCIDPLVDKYLQNNRTRLEMRLRVVKSNGDALSPLHDVVAPNNLIGALIWESVVIHLNGQPFYGASNVNAGLKAYIDMLLSTEDGARHTHAQTQVLHMDSPDCYEEMGYTPEEFVDGAIYELERGSISPFPPGLLAAREQPAGGVATLTDAQKADTYKFPYTGAEAIGGLVYVKREAAADWILDEGRKVAPPAAGQSGVFRTAAALYGIDTAERNRNFGFRTREKMVRYSSEFQVVAPIPHDFFNLNNHIGPGNRIDIELTAYKDAFLLNSRQVMEGYKLEIVDMKLHLRAIERRERIHPPLVERYRMNQTVLTKHFIPDGMTRYRIRVHHNGVQPKTLVFAFNDTRAVEGAYDRNPLHFPHFRMTKIQLSMDGETYPTNGIEFDFNRDNPFCIWGYHWLFENTGCLLSNRGNMVSLNQFMTGAFLVPFDMTPDKCNGVHNHKSNFGPIDVELEWAEPLASSVTLICEAVWNKLVINDKMNSQLSTLDVDA